MSEVAEDDVERREPTSAEGESSVRSTAPDERERPRPPDQELPSSLIPRTIPA